MCSKKMTISGSQLRRIRSSLRLLLAPADVPSDSDSALAAFEADVAWFRALCGHLQHFAKARHDALPAINMYARFAHRPSAEANKALKHVMFYLLHTKDEGLFFGASPFPRKRILNGIDRPLTHDHKMDPASRKSPRIPRLPTVTARYVTMTGARQGCCICSREQVCQLSACGSTPIHAVDAHGSECFSASTAAAQGISIRGVLTELRIRQEYQALPLHHEEGALHAGRRRWRGLQPFCMHLQIKSRGCMYETDVRYACLQSS